MIKTVVNFKKFIFVAVFALFFTLTSQGRVYAVPIFYEGDITSGIPVFGSVSGGGWVNEIASEVDFWRFFGTAGDVIDLRGDRLDIGLDTAFSLDFGTTAADESAFDNGGDFGGLNFLLIRDDEISNPGPFGDPFLDDFVLPSTGFYTVAIGGFLSSTPDDQYRYQLALSGATGEGGNGEPVIPEPMSMILLGSGFVGLAASRKKSLLN